MIRRAGEPSERSGPSGPLARDPFLLDPFEPAYLALHRKGELAARAREAVEELRDCRVCPRDCRVNRLANETRICHTGRHARVASAFPHFGEEDCLRGTRGSGTIFFSLCNLRCVFCQNWDISQKVAGEELDASGIADLMLALQEHGCHNVNFVTRFALHSWRGSPVQEHGCHNVNFVTPEHVAPQVIEAIARAVPRGLRVPIVYNTSAYDSIRSLELLDGLVDVYMPDLKFFSPETSKRLAKAKDYPEAARAAILEMHRQVGPLRFGPDGLARRGVLVRHLVMPGQGGEARALLRWLAEEVSPDTYVNLMAQYSPQHEVGTPGRTGEPRYAQIDRRPARDELARAYRSAREAGLWRLDERRPLSI